MAVAVFARYPGLSPETYDEVVASLDLDANPPAGAILHLVGEGDGALLISEIWRTEQTFQAFHDFRLVPALQMHGFANSPEVEITPLHNLFAVEMETIERMGAVSRPTRVRRSRRAAPLSAVSTHVDEVPLDPTGVLDETTMLNVTLSFCPSVGRPDRMAAYLVTASLKASLNA